MVTGFTIAELEATIAAHIVAVDVTPFRQLPIDAFRESRNPLTAVEDTTALAHLAFSVSVESAPVTDDEAASPGSGSVSVAAEVVVVFVYKIAGSAKMATYRAASDAARAVLRAVMAPDADYNILPRNVFKPGIIQDGFMPVEMRFQVFFDLTY